MAVLLSSELLRVQLKNHMGLLGGHLLGVMVRWAPEDATKVSFEGSCGVLLGDGGGQHTTWVVSD
jgi:hypothetical protein